MKAENSKFLEFNGKSIFFLSKDGQWWVAIKPICEALEVNYDRQQKNIKADEILGQLYAVQHMVAADNKLRKMLCLPEKYIYGWLFSINSESSQLLDYKRECYEVLFDHFHGAITERTAVLKEKTMKQLRLEKLEANLRDNPDYQEYLQLKKGKSAAVRALNGMDNEIVKNQLPLWAPEIDN